MTRTELFIDGTWRVGGTSERFPVHEPATGTELASVADATVGDARAAVAAAHRAQPAWAAEAPRRRSDVLRRAFELMLARADGLAELIVRENGKPIAEARGEVVYAAEFFRWFSEEAVRLDGRLATAPAGTNRMLVVQQPIGVALLVTPWNFPAAMATRKIGPALAAGCAVVLKPASETPLTALAVAAILAEAGVPPGVVNVVPTSRNAEVVAAILRDPRVRKLSFTGSTEVGRLLLAQAAERVLKCSMELGGNAPFIVFADADLDAALEGAMVAKLRHNGEACTAANRFYVERPVAEEFTRRLSAAMGALPMGNGLDPAVRIGPLVDAATRAKVARLVAAAVAAGARLRTGGVLPGGPGFFYPATVLDRVAPDSPILAEEIFGPVAPIVAFDDVDDVIRLANATEQGLISYVFTRDLARGLRVAEALESGMVGLNRGLVSDPAAPFGGMKQSGIGREGGHDGLLEYTETKYIAVQW
jgi:succinate-semialdehyde dehydrogenase/glutarate-semialdehyde dehydrogenase